MDMLTEDSKVLHDQFRLMKNAGIHPLQNKFIFFHAIQGHQEGVMDISFPISLDIDDFTLRVKLISGGGNPWFQNDPKIFQ